MMRSIPLASTVLIPTLLVGCTASNGEGLDENGRPLNGGGDNQSLEATFSSTSSHRFVRPAMLARMRY